MTRAETILAIAVAVLALVISHRLAWVRGYSAGKTSLREILERAGSRIRP